MVIIIITTNNLHLQRWRFRAKEERMLSPTQMAHARSCPRRTEENKRGLWCGFQLGKCLSCVLEALDSMPRSTWNWTWAHICNPSTLLNRCRKSRSSKSLSSTQLAKSPVWTMWDPVSDSEQKQNKNKWDSRLKYEPLSCFCQTHPLWWHTPGPPRDSTGRQDKRWNLHAKARNRRLGRGPPATR